MTLPKMFKSPNTLMVQGTTSDAGKSLTVAAIGRILYRHGVKVAPFKPQNMALNSAVTAAGGEIGRAQAVQALACGLTAHVDMNPVLLKPNSDNGSQVILLGKAVGNMKAGNFNRKKTTLLPHVLAAHQRLSKQYHAVVVEGAGSPAEINLRQGDIANMGFAEEVDCPVVIVADIDRGGVYAHLYGTYLCLSDSEKKRVVGFVINKFRGDQSLLAPANDWLTQKTGVPILAVIPYIPDLYIEAEDAIDTQQSTKSDECLNVHVVVYPRISNHTDFDALRLHPQINLTYVRNPQEAADSDLIILPGSKNVQADLAWLKSQQWDAALNKHLRYDGKVLGICGGYQMLGKSLSDPQGIEGQAGLCSNGLGLLDLHTTLHPDKILRNVSGHCLYTQASIKGYEIHAGQSKGGALNSPLFNLRHDNGVECAEGAMSEDGQIKGTYLHGVLDSQEYLQSLLTWCGIAQAQTFDYEKYKLEQLDYLADEVEKAWPFEAICELLKLST
ncbi:cobyric acid synthase [Marinagarivorans algicola]|uniref:cobyric acid synthase n=1 Tax=Marinagarivorans algicola TaxID=1513270 RepID=UPI0009E9C533|nr:cobyric acid synthase [Marinagarivorans algicola]